MNDILKQAILTAFYEAYEQTEAKADRIAMRVKSTGATEDYAWLGQLKGMREMFGERVPQKLKDYGYTLRNREFEESIEVRQADIKDDQTGKYEALARSLGQEHKEFPDDQIFGALLPEGENRLCYDGQNFFDTDHPVGDGSDKVQSNLLSGHALTAENYGKARAALRAFKGDAGRRVNKRLDLVLVVPAELEAAAKEIIGQEKLLVKGVMTNNPHYNDAEVLVSTELTDATEWYLLNVAGEVKPFVIQERDNEPLSMLGDESERGWWNKINYYGTYWRGNFGYGLWHKAIKCKP